MKLMTSISFLYMDRLDTLDTLLFGKNKNIIFYDNWYLLQQEQKQQQQQQNNTFTSNLIKKYFFLLMDRVDRVDTLSRNKEGELTNDYQ